MRELCLVEKNGLKEDTMMSISVSVNHVYSMKHSQNWNVPTLTGYIEITKNLWVCG